ncbi:TGF-BETA-2 domain-containing protein [Aphelenchoides fujianensis]|nr:TGF-BETA-2 domain-containing protein [Aphelenchoides fujianensis]
MAAPSSGKKPVDHVQRNGNREEGRERRKRLDRRGICYPLNAPSSVERSPLLRAVPGRLLEIPASRRRTERRDERAGGRRASKAVDRRLLPLHSGRTRTPNRTEWWTRRTARIPFGATSRTSAGRDPRLLQERPAKKPRRPRFNPNDPMLGFGSMPAEEETQTAAPTVGLRAAREDLTVYLLGGENRRSNEQQCAKRDFVIHFNEIGWGEWVIAPKKFEAHYCAGTCTFPLGQEHNPSNHAQLQSIAHQLGLQPGLPPACCAPQRLDSQTLLYYDESGDVVLKNYPKMIVSSCGCA